MRRHRGNIGIITLSLARLAPEGHVYTFEPVPNSYAYLERNVHDNELGNVTATPIGIGAAEGELQLSYVANFSGGAFSSSIGVTDGVPVTAPVRRFDDWMADAGPDHLDLVKIDIEGGELDALKGARRTLRTMRPDLVIELNPFAMTWLRHRRWSDLVEVVSALYPHVYYIRADGSVVTPTRPAHWRRLLALHGHLDLYCTHRRAPGGAAVRARALARRVLDNARAARALRRDHTPARCFQIEPDYTYRVLDDVKPAPCASVTTYRVEARNNSSFWLSSDFVENPVMASYRWLDDDGAIVSNGTYTRLPAPIAPGHVATFELDVTFPSTPGSYRLLPTFNQIDVAWLDDLLPDRGVGVPVEAT